MYRLIKQIASYQFIIIVS